MGYNTYYTGELTVFPELTSDQRRRLSTWLGMNGYKIMQIVDAKLDKRMKEAGFKYDIAWNPIDTIDANTITVCTESGAPHVIAMILKRIIEKLPNNAINGEIFWDGDEQEDIGVICIENNKVWICPASIVYAIPAGTDSELIP